ncbi:MAG: bifunctional phosphoribosyl-AMP cyclohydrolase/phosphoribosyl-ATP diphosphatase HisIE [Flammeovirgaceae bacterium]|nr:bifunctional phosphoribosyl-AMP cyclohydrolase/phosphoribosyl-ATP diphosphatase HisIE [Flammeovirgaceae bacterium]
MELDFTKLNGLVPAVVQDAQTDKVLMVAFMNKAALEKTIVSGQVTFYSRTKSRLWTKGETSGNYLDVVSLHPDCDRDTLLIKVNPKGPVCHTGADTCFNEINEDPVKFITYLERIISERKDQSAERSYTASLFKKGINKIAQKVGEEAVELVIESKDDNPELFVGEAADLLFHYLILLEAKEIPFKKIIEELKNRHSQS